MQLPSLDLNLLVALNALLTERNVTRAGEKIGLSQPATSAALARLRRHFGDELLERVGSTYRLTALATSLLEQSELALRSVEDTFSARPIFDAAKSSREFVVVASDYALTVIGGALADLLQDEAPDVRLRFQNINRHAVDDAADALRSADALIMPHGYVRGLPGRLLFSDQWVLVAGRRDGGREPTLTAADLSAARWVVVYDGPTEFTQADKSLSLMGVQRRADIVVENFGAVVHLVAGTNRLALLPRRMAQAPGAAELVDIIEVPLELPSLREHAWWHPSHASDLGHRWLIGLISRAATESSHQPRE